MKRKNLLAVLVVVLIALVAFLLIDRVSAADHVAVIEINGFIDVNKAESINKLLDVANSNKNIKGILLDIDSPGSTIVAAEEVVSKVNAIEKPIVSYIKETGASGAYWIAASTDKIVANSFAVTGSIGVTRSYFQISKKLEEEGVSYEQITSGEFKELGNPYTELTDKERNVLQSKIDKVYNIFLNDVKTKRNLTDNATKEVGKGDVYLGVEAKELGLIDELGGREAAINELKKLLDSKKIRLVDFKEKSNGITIKLG